MWNKYGCTVVRVQSLSHVNDTNGWTFIQPKANSLEGKAANQHKAVVS